MKNPLLDKLLHFQALLDAGSQIRREELSDEEWILLGKMKTEREKLVGERVRERHEEIAGPSGAS